MKLSAFALAAVTFALAGCGSSDAPAPPPANAAVESVDKLPKLPPGWVEVDGQGGGFALARPPGWSASEKGSAVQLVSPDHLVVVSISADRTGAGLAIEPGQYASRALAALKGYSKAPKPSHPKPLKRFKYNAVSVTSHAVSAKKVPQDLEVIVLRRPKLVTFTEVVASNSKSAPPGEAAAGELIASTIRSRPSTGAPVAR